jgi:tRNA threonylcarbamoyladenosine biosynthesis protein TsaB
MYLIRDEAALISLKILALETSTNACSAALQLGDALNFSCIERFEIAPRQHTQLILPMIESLLQEADFSVNDMDVLAFGRGPGAFTGVRVATGITQGISFGAGLPVAQISSLAAMAQGIVREHSINKKGQQILVANDARMDEIYFAAFENDAGFMTLLGQEQIIRPQRLMDFLDNQSLINNSASSWLCVGSGWDVYAPALQTVLDSCTEIYISAYPHARDVAYLAIKEVENSALVDAEFVSPVYLRDNVAKKPAVTT